MGYNKQTRYLNAFRFFRIRRKSSLFILESFTSLVFFFPVIHVGVSELINSYTTLLLIYDSNYRKYCLYSSIMEACRVTNIKALKLLCGRCWFINLIMTVNYYFKVKIHWRMTLNHAAQNWTTTRKSHIWNHFSSCRLWNVI